MPIKPVTGMLRRQIVLDLSVAMASLRDCKKICDDARVNGALWKAVLTTRISGLGLTAGYGWWYGYHVPAVRHRDAFYQKLEDERAATLGQN
ncbi:Cytochrome c oxidase subunit 7A [Pleosporales sp. CAS-2024a]